MNNENLQHWYTHITAAIPGFHMLFRPMFEVHIATHNILNLEGEFFVCIKL